MTTLEKLEQEIETIKERNRRVEKDKAWETSWFRVFAICIITYVFAALFLFLIGSPNFLVSALVPVVGFFLSTQSLPFIKRWWLRNRE